MKTAKYSSISSLVMVLCLVLAALTALPAEAVLTLEGEVNPNPIEPGELFDFQLTVATTAVTGSLTLRVLWPAALDFRSPVATNGGSCPGTCDAGEYLTWNLGVLGPSTSLTVSFNEDIPSLANGTSIPFQVELREAGVLKVQKTYTIEVQSSSPLELAVDPLFDPVLSGGKLTYELVYGNTAVGVSNNTEMRFPVPAGTQFVAATGGGVLVGGEVVWNLGSVGAGTGGRRRVLVDVDNLSAESLLVVDAARITGNISFQARMAEAMAVSRVSSEPLSFKAEIDPDPLAAFELIESQISIGNTAASPTGSLSVRLLWPDELDFQSPVTTAGGSCPGTCDAGEYVFWNVGVLGPQSTLVLAMNEPIQSVANGTLVPFEIELIEDGLPARTFSRTLIARSDSPLELAVDPLADPALKNAPLVYELSYGNAGSASASDAVLTFPVPGGTSFVSATGGGTFSGGLVRWNLGSLSPNSGGSERVTVQVGALADDTTLLINAAELNATVSFLPQVARATAVSRVDTELLDLQVEAQPDPVNPFELIDLQISLANPRATPTGSLSLRLLWPDELDFQSPVTTAGGSCPGTCDQGEYVLWNIGTLGPGAALTVAMNEPIQSFTNGTLVPFEIELLEASINARTVSRTVLGSSNSPLELAIDPLTDPVPPSTRLSYQLTYGNLGSSTVSNAKLTFPIPAGTSFRSASAGGVHAGGVVTWNLGTLPPNSGGRVEVSVMVGALTTPDLIEVDMAALTGTVNFLPQRVRASAVVRVASEPLQLAFTLGPEAVQVSDLINGTLTVTNPTGTSTGQLTLRLLWPEELDFRNPNTSDGGDCPGTCDAGEYLLWNLGVLGPAQQVQVSFTEDLPSHPDGRLIPFEIELLEANFPTRNASRTVIYHPDPDILEVVLFTDGFESGNISAWSSSVP